MGFFAFAYAYSIGTREITPSLLTWLMLFVALGGSLWTYVVHERRPVRENPGNLVDFVVVVVVLTTALASGRFHWRVELLDLSLWILSFGILVFWRYAQLIDTRHANIALQVLITLSVLPTMKTVLVVDGSSEGILHWLIVLAGSLCMVGHAWLLGYRNSLEMVYAARSCVTAGAVVASILLS